MTTLSLSDWTQSPEILVGEEERRRLTVIALTDLGHGPERTDYLLYELDRARVVPDADLPREVVRLGSAVTYRTPEGRETSVKLVLPDEAQPGLNRLSVTSEHGSALLGLRPGQTISWLDRQGATQALTVLRVLAP